ncbi:DUF1330 domain-containing protein [Hyphomonas sp.]|uniref:DUF1330 domain-containing protein n=1 Tax=Hyphomonas sp. TaxID=87 RepID=UPI00391A430A
MIRITRRGLATPLLPGLLIGAACASTAAPSEAPATPKGYVIAEIEVTDPEAYAAYVAAAGPLVAQYGGVYLVRGGRSASWEGAPPAGRLVVIEFPSFAAAEAFQVSPEYAAIAPIRRATAVSRLMVVEGRAP